MKLYKIYNETYDAHLLTYVNVLLVESSIFKVLIKKHASFILCMWRFVDKTVAASELSPCQKIIADSLLAKYMQVIKYTENLITDAL